MRVSDSYNHFVAIVAGDEPEKYMEPYEIGKKLDTPITVYRFKDAGKLHNDYIGLYKALLKNDSISKEEKSEIQEELAEIESMSDVEFYYDITDEYEYDPDTGDAMTTSNPNGKWYSYNPGKVFSIPFVLKDERVAYSARKGDIDWDKMHLCNQEVYESAWDMVMDGKKPENEMEETIFENMKNRTAYFHKFETKENYVVSSTAFWGYAFVNDHSWSELEDDMDQYDWMKNFYDRFIKHLPDDTLLTIYECRKE